MSDELGYDGVEIFKRGRFRPATFWKTARCELVTPAVHKDRCLLTAFRPKMSSETSGDENRENDKNGRNWYVCNCHLQAGKQGPRRVRQIHDAIRGVLTMARKQKEPEPEKSLRLVVCGDFNGDSECGAVRYLEDGFVDETFREDNEPVSSKRKEMPLECPMLDVTRTIERESPPPTLIVAELISNLMKESTYDNPELSTDMIDRLERIYKRLTANNKEGVMAQQEVEQWLEAINLQAGRGDEYREAAKQMGWVDPNPDDSYEEKKKRVKIPKDGVLTLEGFIQVYQNELLNGKFWGIGHDMAVLGDPLPDAGLFEARYDRMYCSAALQPIAVLDTISKLPCPNSQEPSDHLPVGAAFQVSI